MVVLTPAMQPERFAASYVNRSERFSKRNNDFTKQYCSIYKIRLEKMAGMLQERINQKWGSEYPVCKLHKLAEVSFPKCIVFGTLFKDQKLKPSILKELAEINNLVPQPIYDHFTDESDTLYVEDELQRYQIQGDIINSKEIVTGITCALLGSDLDNGKFLVKDYCFIEMRPQVERPLMEKDMYVVFVSCLDLAHAEKSALSLNLFVDWITGLFSDTEVQNIVRLVIAGDSVHSEIYKHKVKISMTSRNVESDSTEPIKLFDTILLQLCQSLEVDVMPGEHDPSNYVLPQKPMHPCMFPNSMTYKSTNLVSNPYDCEIGGLRFLGSSGEPINNILNFSDISQPIDALEKCLRWSHLAPTAPDTLGCFPFYDTDPFIIEDCPHVMFAGNQSEFSTKLVNGPENQQVRLICIPKFSTTSTIVLLNLKTLDCTTMSF